MQMQFQYARPGQSVVAVNYGKVGPRDWTFGLCECCDDLSACCMTCCCPCLTAGEIYEKGLEQSFFGGCCLWVLMVYVPSTIVWLLTQINLFTFIPLWAMIYPLMWTAPLREKRGIEGNYLNDCCCVYWCSCCQMIREVREAKLMREERLTGAQQIMPIPMTTI